MSKKSLRNPMKHVDTNFNPAGDSKDLTLRLEKGFSHSNLSNMSKSYEYYLNIQTLSGKLSWLHICEIINSEDKLERGL